MSSSTLSRRGDSDFDISTLPKTTETLQAAAHRDIVSLLSVAEHYAVELLPLTWQRARAELGEGGEAYIRPSVVQSHVSIAFKSHKAFDVGISDDRGSQRVSQVLNSMMTEIAILSQPLVRDSPHVINLQGISWSVQPDSVWPVLVYSQGIDLRDFLRQRGSRLSLSTKLDICYGICSGLEALHRSGAVHGDLKPANILVYQSRYCDVVPQISDLSLSVIGPDSAHRRLPRSRFWSAPEWHDGYFTICNARYMDVYSLGLLCYWVLAWDEETLHGSSDDADLIMRQPQAGKSGAILAKAISILGDMSISHPIRESLESFFKQTLDSDPKKRATSAIQLLPLWTHTGDPESKFSQSGDELPLPCPPPVMLPACSFNIRKSMAQLSVVDFRVRELIFQGLEQSMTSECGNCVSNNALQAYICCETGYGTDVSPEKAQGFQAKGKLDSGVISSAIQDLEHSHRPFEHGKLPFYITADLFHEYQLRGEVDAACERLHKEIEGMQNTLGPDHAVVNLFKSSLADVLYLSGKVQEAKITQKDVYESHLRVLGEGNPDTLRSMAQLALVLDYAGHNSEAIRLGEEALAISKKWLPMETRLRMSIEANLAGAYFHDGRFEDAERLQRSVVEVHEAELGSEHEDTVRCLINLSAFVNELPHPKRQDAIHISHRVWMVQKAVHGEQHRDTLQAHANYLGALSNAGNSELCRKDLVKQVREHLEAAKSFLGPDSIDTCMYAANLGVCLLQSDKMSEGREVLQETHSRLIELLGSSAWLTLDVGNHAARSLYYEGRYAEAEAICKEILTTGNLGADVSVELTFRARCTLGLCYEQGDHKEAISQFEMAAELSRQHWGSEFAHNDSRMIVSYLQDLYKTTGHWNSAIDLNRRLVEWVAPDDPRMLDYEVDLAGSYVKGGQSAKALESLPDLYERSKSRYGLLHHVTVAVQTHLTNAYSGCKMYKEAIEFSREVLSYMEATEESSLEDRLLVMNNLAAYLMETGSFSESEELLVRIKNTYEHECNHRGVCLAMHNLAALFHDQGQITEATLEQRKLVARYVDKHDTDSFDSVEESYYLAFYLSDDPGQKQEALQTAQKAWKSSYDKFGSNHVLTIKAAGLTGVIFRDLYELDKAKDFFEKELDGARDMVPCDDQDEYVRGAEEHMDSLSKQQQKPNPVSIIADANDDPTRSDLLP